MHSVRTQVTRSLRSKHLNIIIQGVPIVIQSKQYWRDEEKSNLFSSFFSGFFGGGKKSVETEDESKIQKLERQYYLEGRREVYDELSKELASVGSEECDEKLKKLCKAEADRGNVKAAGDVASLYQVEKDTKNVIKYYSMDKKTGDYKIGYYFQAILPDEARMEEYYSKASEQGCADAMHNLGFHYEGKGDYEKMMKYYLMAAEKGFVASLINLGLIHEKRGELDLAYKYASMAAGKDSGQGYFLLGNYYTLIGDTEKALEHFEKAANKNVPGAMNNLGVHYEKMGDVEKTLHYYTKAAERSDKNGAMNLGLYYQQKKDYVNMVKYFRMSIEAKNGFAYEYLVEHFMQTNDIDEVI